MLSRTNFRDELSQSELAGRVGISRAAVSALEAGMQGVSLVTLCKIAVALEVPPSALLPDEKELLRLLKASKENNQDASPDEIVDEFLKGVGHGNQESEKQS